MFCDIVGYTALMAESEAKGQRVRERQAQVLRPLVEQYGGDWVEHVGDEALSSFPSAVHSVNCALAIQAVLGDEPELSVRIGIHVGDVVFRQGGLLGDGVNIAARIYPLAAPGGICVSDEVQHAIRNQENIETVLIGEQELKNVGRPVSVFVVSGTARPPPVRSSERPAEHRDGIRSLAVLPLDNLGSPEQEYVADGVTDALIESLARVGPELRVTSRTSVMQYKGTTKLAREIADELGVTLLIEGTAQRQDDRVLIRVQLVEAREDAHLWTQSYERDLRDFFSLQREIARTVAGEIEIALKPEREPLLAATRPVDPEALDAYLRGLELRGPSALLVSAWGPPAIEQFERAVRLDPGFAEAWVELAEIRYELAFNGFNLGYRGQMPLAREAAERALKIDPRLGAAHAILGGVLGVHDWDFPGARAALERAVGLSPSDPFVLMPYAFQLLLAEGRAEEAFDVADRAERVAPFDPAVRGYRMNLFLYGRQPERGLEEARRARELDPSFTSIEVGMLYQDLGRLEEAFEIYLELFERYGPPGDPTRKAMLHGWEQSGFEGAMRAALEVWTATDGFSPYVIAGTYAGVGETDQAFLWLERAYSEREPLLIWLRVHPSFDSLRSDPRYDDLVRRIGFPKNVEPPVSVHSLSGTATAPAPVQRAAHPARPRLRPAVLAAAGAALLAGLGWWALSRSTVSVGPIRSVAVLPLENLSGDPEQEYVADGMTEELIGELARLGALSVISRTSVMRYKPSDRSIPEIASELGVEGVIEGTVTREQGRIRVTVQLIDARTDTHLWSDRFDRELSSVLALRRDVAQAVAEQLRLELTPEEDAALKAGRMVDPRAFDAYLRGLELRGPYSFLISVWGPPAIEQFERAVSLDPEFAQAWVELAEIRLQLGVVGWNLGYRGQLPLAREAAERALRIDPRLGAAHAILGSVRGVHDWDFPGARDAFERAVRLSPSDPFVLTRYAFHLLLAEGRAEEAFDVADRAERVAPFDPAVRGHRMTLFLYGGQPERGLEEARQARELDPSFIHMEIAMLYEELGRFEEAFGTLIELTEQCGPPCDPIRKAMLHGWERSGFEGALRAALEVETATDGFSPWVIASTYAGIGETDQAFAWLERAYREREPLMLWLRVNPSFDPLRSDPRYDDLVRRIGFPELAAGG